MAFFVYIDFFPSVIIMINSCASVKHLLAGDVSTVGKKFFKIFKMKIYMAI